MKVCLLKEVLKLGGTERSAANISKILEKNHEVIWALYDASDVQYNVKGQIFDLKAPPRTTKIGKIFNSFKRHFRVKKLIKKQNIDALYTFTAIENLTTSIRYKNTVKIISARDFGKMQSKTAKFNKALKKSNAMICNSNFTKDFYLEKYPLDKEKVFTLYNYIDVEEIYAQSLEQVEKEYEEFIYSHKNVLVSVGRFCKEKGFEYLLDAFYRAKTQSDNLGLVLVGDGAKKGEYESIIQSLGIEKDVYFTGFTANPYKYMAKCSAFVLSSISEGFPNVLAEAMALGLSVISTNCYSGPAEILREDSDYSAVKDTYLQCDYGIITPRLNYGDNENAIVELSKAIIRLLSNEQLKKEYSNKAKQRAQEFSFDKTKRTLNQILIQIANDKK